MRIAVDAMGGDNAPEAIIEGVQQAVGEFKQLHVTLVGNEKKIREYLSDEERIDIIHTEEVIGGEEEPIRAIRRKKDSSLALTAKEVKEKRADACISAGNTGALVVAGLFIVGRMKGIERPALSPTLPTIDDKGFLLLDVGANVDATANNLVQYAVMGSTYAEKVRGIDKPKIALLNVGTEDGKGSTLTKKAFQLLQEAPINFIGNMEARDILSGDADVVVTDGFSGNITLKTVEGTAMHVIDLLKEILSSSLKTKLAAGMIMKDLRGLKAKLDYTEFGGAALFGLDAPVIKSHGSSNGKAIYSTIKQTIQIIEQDVIGTIKESIDKLQLSEEDEHD